MTLTNNSIKDASAALAKTMSKRSQANFTAYSRVRSSHVFSVGIKNPQEIGLWIGDFKNTKYEIVGASKKHRQCVLRVQEEKRMISQRISIPKPWFSNAKFSRDRYRLFYNKLRIGVPNQKPQFLSPFVYSENHVSADFGYRLNKSDQTFLLGVDETAHFICALPRKVKSFAAAHKTLRPSHVPSGSLRQGEFFFVACKPRQIAELDKKLQARIRAGTAVNNALERFSRHRAEAVYKIGKRVYAKGWVVDSRAKHHAPIYLEEWYEVIRNREIKVPGMVRRWD